MDKTKWHERLFGKELLRCDYQTLAAVSDVLLLNQQQHESSPPPPEFIIGIYFSFANINLQNDEFVTKLKGLYERLNTSTSNATVAAATKEDINNTGGGGCGGGSDDDDEGNNKRRKKFEVVQVVLWANNDVYSDFENSHRDSLLGLPWYAVPFSEIDLKTKLSRRYRIKSGVPTLVLVDHEGGTVSVSAQDRLNEDPLGASFPWRPRPIDQVLKDVVLQYGGTYFAAHSTKKQHPLDNKDQITYSDLPSGVRGFYFSANWCPPCRAFTPQLAEVYQLLRTTREPNFEIIFISSDRSAESYSAYVETMPWLTVPWQQAAVRAELAQLYGIRGIPTLLLLDRNGHIITMDARTELAEDPMAQNFPWKPRAVNILTERYATKLHDYPAIVLFVDGEDTEMQFAESVLTPAADTYYAKHNINFSAIQEDFFYNCDDEHYLQFLIGLDTTDTGDILRDLIGLDDDVVPLLVGIDVPSRRFAVMEYGVEITVQSVNDFVARFQRGDVTFVDINNDRMVDHHHHNNHHNIDK